MSVRAHTHTHILAGHTEAHMWRSEDNIGRNKLSPSGMLVSGMQLMISGFTARAFTDELGYMSSTDI